MSAISFLQNSGAPENFTFDGYVEIFMECKESTDKLYLHVNKLDTDNSTIMFRAVDDNHTPPGMSAIRIFGSFGTRSNSLMQSCSVRRALCVVTLLLLSSSLLVSV